MKLPFLRQTTALCTALLTATACLSCTVNASAPLAESTALSAATLATTLATTLAATQPQKAADTRFRMGDVNFDRSVDADDATQILRHYVTGLSGAPAILQGDARTIADVDFGGTVDAKDATAVLRYYVEQLSGMENPNWPFYDGTVPETTPTTASTTTTTTTTSTTSTTTTTTTTTSTTTTTTTTATPTDPIVIGGRTFRMGQSVADLTAAFGNPTEILTQQYQTYRCAFYVYAATPASLFIAMTDGSKVTGFYALGNSYSYQGSAVVNSFTDQQGTQKPYAVLAYQPGYGIGYANLKDRTDLAVCSKLCFHVTNGLRGLNGIAPLRWSEAASAVAYAHSADMASNNYFDHTSQNGTSFDERLSNGGVNWRACAENISAGYTDIFASTNGWYNSAGHRKNILNGTYTNLGIGFAYYASSTYGIYGTQDFFA